MAHITGIGIGCLDPFEDIPQDWFWEAYSSLSMQKIDNLFNKLVSECVVVVLQDTGPALLTGTDLLDVVLSPDVSYYDNDLYELCEKFLTEEQQQQEDSAEIVDDDPLR